MASDDESGGAATVDEETVSWRVVAKHLLAWVVAVVRRHTGRLFLPRVLRGHGVVRGLSIGRCVSNTPGLHRFMAHSHQERRFKGWICADSAEDATDLILLHELAHLISADGHTKRWRRKFIELAADHSPEMLAEVQAYLDEMYTSQPQPRHRTG